MIHFLNNKKTLAKRLLERLNKDKVVLFSEIYHYRKRELSKYKETEHLSIRIANKLYQSQNYKEALNYYKKLYNKNGLDIYKFNMKLCNIKLRKTN